MFKFCFKYCFALLLGLALVLPAFSQRKIVPNNPWYDFDDFHLGFSLGYNNMFYRMTVSPNILNKNKSDSVYGVSAVSEPGFNLGIISEYKISESFAIRALPGMIFGQRDLDYKMRNLAIKDSAVFYTYSMKIPTIYVECPVLIKFKGTRVNNYRPYLIGGGSVRYDLEARRQNQLNTDYTIRVLPLDYFFELGTGIDFYLTYFKLSTELKMSYGIYDILHHESQTQYNNVISQLKSKLFILTLNFE